MEKIMELHADSLRQLALASVAADTGRNAMPHLASVVLVFDTVTETVETIATDRYRAAWFTLPGCTIETGGEFTVDAKQFLAVAKLFGKTETVTVSAEETGLRFTSQTKSGFAEYGTGMHPGRKTAGLFPEWVVAGDACPDELAGSAVFNAEFLADLAKMKFDQARVFPNKAGRPWAVTGENGGIVLRYLVMPIRERH